MKKFIFSLGLVGIFFLSSSLSYADQELEEDITGEVEKVGVVRVRRTYPDETFSEQLISMLSPEDYKKGLDQAQRIDLENRSKVVKVGTVIFGVGSVALAACAAYYGFSFDSSDSRSDSGATAMSYALGSATTFMIAFLCHVLDGAAKDKNKDRYCKDYRMASSRKVSL